MNIANQTHWVSTDSLNVYKELDEDIVATATKCGIVNIWAIDGDMAMHLGGICKGQSNLSIDQLIAKIF
jgi:hypothetical protein